MQYFQDREVIKKVDFYLQGDYRNLNAALEWVKENGFSYAWTDKENLIFLMKGLWKPQNRQPDGIMYSENFREGAVTINIYK